MKIGKLWRRRDALLGSVAFSLAVLVARRAESRKRRRRVTTIRREALYRKHDLAG